MQINGLIKYYRECFKEDSADFNLRYLLGLKKEDLLFISGKDEIATGSLHRLPINPGYGESFSKRIQLYQRERVLLYCSLFIAGNLEKDGETLKVFSPIVFNEARIEHDEYGYYFLVDEATPSVNEELLERLLPESKQLPSLDNNRLYDPSYWAGFLKDSPYQLNYLESLKFPALGTKEDASRAMKRKYPSLIPISCLAFVERSLSSRGLLHELSLLSESQNHSRPTETILGEPPRFEKKVIVNHNLVPGTLSTAQKNVLEIAANQTLGVVSGPPGTGKSFTIAATAAEHFTREKSVLIVANSDTALEVIADKLSKDFGLDNLYVRAGQKSVLKEFKQYLEDLLAGYHEQSEAKHSDKYKRHLEVLIKDIEQDETKLAVYSALAFKHGHRTYKVENDSASLWEKFLHKLSASAINKGSELWNISSHFNDLVKEKERQSTLFLKAEKARSISGLLKTDRKTIQSLNKASRARTSSKQSEYFANLNFESLLKGFPVWLVTLNTLHRVLPLHRELFDLVIVDEATQCNISSVLPALERAKRALIVGDQKQLRHYSFLARAKQTAVAERFDVEHSEKAMSYRDCSILDLALNGIAHQNQVAFLDEHFRSQPELIHFSNKHFYLDKLKVMQHRPCSTIGHIKVIECEGRRTDIGINEKEAEAIIAKIKRLILEDSDKGIVRTIGILSPFSKQVAYISAHIESDFSLEIIQTHAIRVATPFGFQGEERDVMLLSFCIDERSIRAAAYLNKPDVFNVSVTRARQLQFVFKSIDPLSLPADNLLRCYLTSVDNFIIEHKSDMQPDAFQLEILGELESLEIKCWRGYEMLGTYIDVLVRRGNRYLAIDLIGYPGPWQDHFELNTYKVIKRAGVDVFPLSYALWRQDKTLCVNAIQKALG